MATILPDLIIVLGTGPGDASPDNRATDNAQPYVAWVVPVGINQVRFSVRIVNDEGGNAVDAFTTSGPRTSSDKFFQVPPGIAMNDNFSGRCFIEVAISQAASGEFEYVSSKFYFVYDRQLERLFNARQVQIGWNASIDPDNLPVGGSRTYQLQIASDPLFDQIEYTNDTIIDEASLIQYPVPRLSFDIETDRVYFVRARQNDGLDWGGWSKVNAFANYSNVPPIVQIISVTPLGNDDGDMVIVFTIADEDSPRVYVQFTYISPDSISRKAMALLSPTVAIPPGTRQVIWRSNSSEPFADIDATIYARAYDEKNTGPEVGFGPVQIRNANLPRPGGGVGSNNYTFVAAGHVGQRSITDAEDHNPVSLPYLAVISDTQHLIRQKAATRGGWCPIWFASTIGPYESWPGDTFFTIYPVMIRACFSPALMQGQYQLAGTGGFKLNPHALITKFFFRSPLDFANQSDGWPRPHTTRELTVARFLMGYEHGGRVIPYPDDYDWDHRPAWHADREVWADDDAWIQVARPAFTDRPICTTCSGKSWVPSSGPPYTRLVCPNTNCQDGFDYSLPLDYGTIVPTASPDDRRSRIRMYIRPTWRRLSSFMMQRPYTQAERIGLVVASPDPTFVYATQHVMGRHLTRFDDAHGRPVLWGLNDEVLRAPVSRQVDGGVDAVGNTIALKSGASDFVDTQPIPAQILIATSTNFDPGPPLPVAGKHGPLKSDWFMGVDPASNRLMADRPVPSQTGGLPRVTGSIGQVFAAVPMRFRFMQAFWDSYNTIHWQATGSESSYYHVQVTSVLPGGQSGTWSDVKGDNAVFVRNVNLWLISPLVFHMYWNTRNRAIFPDGGRFRIRIRQYDVLGRRFSDWVYSNTFQIFETVSNPVSILSTVYEPWSKRVAITLRVDDTQYDAYNLTKVWYSLNDGETWFEVGSGNILGNTINLSSDPFNQGNIHTIYWATASLNLSPSDKVRVQIEATPTKYLDRVTLPFFKWLSSPNPITDPADGEMGAILGKVDLFSWNDNTDQWDPLDTPQYTPGQIRLLELEREQVRLHPGQNVAAPSGYYNFVDQDGHVTDQTGLNTWLAEEYQTSETNGGALSRLNRSIDDLIDVRVPYLHRQIVEGETDCRKSLIRQGYYAESHFVEADDVISETVITHPVINNSPSIVDVERFWQFRVATRPNAPVQAYDENGYIKPLDVTPLEKVYYKIELDGAASFDSQPFKKPMRLFTTNYTGARLAMAQYSSGQVMTDSNPSIDAARDPAGRPWEGKPSDQTTSSQFTDTGTNISIPSTVTLGGELKILPSLLPGVLASDQLLDGHDNFEGDYYWRVAAYNPVEGPVLARPRAIVTALTELAGLDTVRVSYAAQAHEDITTMSLTNYVDSHFGLQVYGYLVSNASITPLWMNEQALNYVSDRRAPTDSPSRQLNSYPWFPEGKDRVRPAVLYDDGLMQYVLMTAKKHYSGRWRPISSRSMALPVVCEYEAYWDEWPDAAIYGPCLLKAAGLFLLFATAQASTTPRLVRSQSVDADSWSDPVDLTGTGAAANPTVQLLDGIYHLWFERLDSSVIKIFYAISEDGFAFTMQNGGSPVLTRSGVSAPSVIRLNGAWVMYFNDIGSDSIGSAYSSDGVSWTGFKTERSPAAIQDNGNTVMASPRNPCVFIDRYMGNNEVFLAYNYVVPGGQSRVYFSRLEDRMWTQGVANKIFGATGNLISVPSTRDGKSRECNISLSSNGLASIVNLKVRLVFDTFTPQTYEFHRQSEWVNADNAASLQSTLEPAGIWHFVEALKSYPYLRIT